MSDISVKNRRSHILWQYNVLSDVNSGQMQFVFATGRDIKYATKEQFKDVRYLHKDNRNVNEIEYLLCCESIQMRRQIFQSFKTDTKNIIFVLYKVHDPCKTLCPICYNQLNLTYLMCTQCTHEGSSYSIELQHTQQHNTQINENHT